VLRLSLTHLWNACSRTSSAHCSTTPSEASFSSPRQRLVGGFHHLKENLSKETLEHLTTTDLTDSTHSLDEATATSTYTRTERGCRRGHWAGLAALTLGPGPPDGALSSGHDE
jgi:hypothetical protein